MRADGSEKQILTKDSVTQVNVLGEWIYYTKMKSGSSDGGLYKIKLDGSDRTKITSDINYWVYVTKEWIYYANNAFDAKIYRMKHDGTGKMQVGSDSCKYPNVSGDWIYYINTEDGKAYKIRTGRKASPQKAFGNR